MKRIMLAIAWIVTTSVFGLLIGSASTSAQFVIVPDFISQLRPSFERDVVGVKLTDEQWQSFQVSVAILFTTATDEQWEMMRKTYAPGVDDFQWGYTRNSMILEADAFLRGVER